MTGSLASADVGRHNLALVAGRLAELGSASRSELAEATGLARGSVTALVRRLERDGLVRETASIAPSGKGRPRTLLELSGDHLAILTVLVDADRATAVASTLGGARLARRDRRHGRPMGDPGRVADVAAELVEELLAELTRDGRRVAEASVVVWAPVGGEPSVVLADTDLDWGMVDLLALLRERSPSLEALGRAGRLQLLADTAVAAVAEHLDAGRPAELLYLKSDSGIGGAIVVDDAPLDGSHHLAGALGHLPVVPDGVRCGCGQRGCLVTVAGPDVLLAAAGLDGLACEAGLAVALDAFVAGIRAGEPRALAAWRTGRAELARALQILVMAIDPAAIVLGGYLAGLADELAEELAAIQPGIDGVHLTPPPVLGSRLGGDAALLGAERTAAARALADPAALAP
ncbi:ROK family transcriptional regulator [Agromyces sp. NBRC 114283]|uniref:ROK family transcriptional regulator n=1 Tax=Agromyces sp. NBRC 114283 TaxID=2994521 RepID=UPI0024A2355F|nr:ROK family transcriptional regulator [Agromyces sp. NBRC 114283]GLU87835.1 transcriptional regulator [Agromyces sp. NBRC 114283]